jgi:hypothetical protein
MDNIQAKWASGHKQAWLDLQAKLSELDKFLNDNWMELRTHKYYTIPRIELGDDLVDHLERMQQYADKHIAYIDELES